MGSLERLLAEGVISEVLARLQSGKEAEVYVVRFGNKVVAAKVYKDREHRSFKNNSSYKEGRAVRNSRSARAMERGSRFGKATAEDAWKSAEADALYKLHAAEVRVPTPVLFLDGVLLMELVLDAEGQPARRLIDTGLTAEQANAAYHDMLVQLVRILSCDLIHGDLSPYNVLWGASGPTVIDFPQIVSASHNSSSERFFLRDAANILGHFERIDPSLQARRGDASEIWRAYMMRELTPEFRPTGRARPAPPPPRPSFPRSSPRGPVHPAQNARRRDAGPGRPAQDPRGGRPAQDPRGGRPAQDPRGGRPPPFSPPFRGPRRPAPAPEVIVRARRPVLPAPSTTPTPTGDRGPAGPRENAERPLHQGRRRGR